MKKIMDAIGPYLVGALLVVSVMASMSAQRRTEQIAETKGACDAVRALLADN